MLGKFLNKNQLSKILGVYIDVLNYGLITKLLYATLIIEFFMLIDIGGVSFYSMVNLWS